MIPFAGLSLIVHAIVLIIKFLGKMLGLSGQKIKVFFLRWGLSLSPRLSLNLLNFNSSWRLVASVLIIIVITSFTVLNNFVLLRLTLRDSATIPFLADTFKSSLALAGQSNSDKLIEVDASTTEDSATDYANIPAPTQTPGQDNWIAAQYQPIDNSLASNYHKQSGLKPAISSKLLLDKN